MTDQRGLSSTAAPAATCVQRPPSTGATFTCDPDSVSGRSIASGRLAKALADRDERQGRRPRPLLVRLTLHAELARLAPWRAWRVRPCCSDSRKSARTYRLATNRLENRAPAAETSAASPSPCRHFGVVGIAGRTPGTLQLDCSTPEPGGTYRYARTRPSGDQRSGPRDPAICLVNAHESALATVHHPPLANLTPLRSPGCSTMYTSLLPSADRCRFEAIVVVAVSASAGPPTAVPEAVRPSDQIRVSDLDTPNTIACPSRETVGADVESPLVVTRVGPETTLRLCGSTPIRQTSLSPWDWPTK